MYIYIIDIRLLDIDVYVVHDQVHAQRDGRNLTVRCTDGSSHS